MSLTQKQSQTMKMVKVQRTNDLKGCFATRYWRILEKAETKPNNTNYVIKQQTNCKAADLS